MSMFNIHEFQQQVDGIVKEYLYKISSLKNHNYFKNEKSVDIQPKSLRNHAFGLLDCDFDNYYVVEEEMFLEGCTRVFLINPIFKVLLENHEIMNDWQFGNTFADFSITNREYELGSFLEFIAMLDGKRIGIRYTKASYSLQEIYAMKRDSAYTLGKVKIPGFDKLCTIDTLYVLNWTGNLNEELLESNFAGKGITQCAKEIPVKTFFEKYFSNEEYELVISVANKAIKKAKEIIALRAVPQLLSDNMLLFKESVLEDFSERKLDNLVYEFQSGDHTCSLSADDVKIMKTVFMNDYYRALIGKSDFAKSFITSEYLFRTVREGISIDYTSIVVGYLKSVEQLLYLLYTSAFEGNSRMEYWDKCNKKKHFDITNSSQFRYDPYHLEEGWKQEYDSRKKRNGKHAPDIGELARFLRYYEKMWRISETGKEYVYECLDDFRQYYRNLYFHKNNINASDYVTVKRIRNNTHVCLYYLIGGFYFLDSSESISKQLGIIDYRFENLYRLIRQKRIRCFDTKFCDGSQCVICYLNDDEEVSFSEDGELKKARLHFLRTEISREDAFVAEINELMNDKEFISKHSLYISYDSMPLEMNPITLKKKK